MGTQPNKGASSGSPVSDDGRGLKHAHALALRRGYEGSPVSDDGRGLKRRGGLARQRPPPGSPVSDDGRGLKLFAPEWTYASALQGLARQR